jgi:hypothetical protein
MHLSRIVTSALVLALGATTFAAAQPVPPPTPAPIVVPSLPPSTPNADLIRAAIGFGVQLLEQQRRRDANNTYGTVTYYKRFEMQVQCGTNCYRNIHLHQGTVINPRGATPSPGSRVTVSGDGQPDGSLEALTITVQQ